MKINIDPTMTPSTYAYTNVNTGDINNININTIVI